MKKQHPMQFHRGNVKLVRRSLCILLSLCLLVTGIQLTLNAVEKDSDPIVSLSAIEELKVNYTSTETTFTILEVVPISGTGSMGYYVPGQEPLSYEGVDFVEYFNLATIEADAREADVDEMITNLMDLGILSAGDETALSTTETGYKEYLAGITALEDIPEEAVRIDLVNDDGTTRTESITLLEGDFEYKQNSTGEFIQENYAVTLNKNDGEYVQAIDYFVYLDSDLAEIEFKFYYVPTFEEFKLSDITDSEDDSLNSATYSGRAIYTQDTSGYFVYQGSLGVNDFTLDLNSTETYYWVSDLALVPYENAQEALDAVPTTASTNALMSTFSLVDTTIDETENASDGTAVAARSASDGTTVASESASDGTTVTDSTALSGTASTYAYVAVGDFIKVTDGSTGYFDVESAYIYQGENLGNFSYNPDATDGSPKVKYSYIYLDAGFTNNNWFRQYVLDDYSEEFADAFNIKVVEVLPTELTEDAIKAASLVVFSAGFSLDFADVETTYASSYESSNDISAGVNTYLQAAIENDGHKELETPIVIDGNLQGNTNATNLEAFIKQSIIALVDQYGTENDILDDAERDNINEYGAAEGGLYYIAQGESLVTRFIAEEFVFDSDEDDEDIFDYSKYYSEVTSTIVYENFVRDTTGIDQLTGQPAEISIATSIRHILMVGNQFSVKAKDSIRVLEIQPAISSDDTDFTNDQVLDEEQVQAWFDNDTMEVTIDRMCSSEFIGKIDDITELYDVVYIGADFGNFNKREVESDSDQQTNGDYIVDYNDDLMDGLFYVNIGDTYTVSSTYQYWFTGLLNSDYAYDSDGDPILSNGYYALDSKQTTHDYRFSGNDITPTKLEELETFVATGFPVVISDSLVEMTDEGEDQIRIDRVDKASYMYDFLSIAISESNVFTVSDLSEYTNQIKAVQYLNLTKPSIVFESKPTEYTSDSQLGGSLVTNNTVEYKFKIENDTDPTPEDTLYSVNLYIDQDADGTHEESELISELTIVDAEGNSVASTQLKPDVMYTVSKTLPDSYQGCIPWKLEVAVVERDYFHTSEKGYTYIQPSSAVSIKILQIYDGGSGSGKIEDNFYYDKYIDEIEIANVYDLNFEYITINNLNNNYNNSIDDTYSYLNSFDMLILGFSDGYGIYNSGGLDTVSCDAVAQFVDSGKAVLFTHDNSFSNNVPSSSYPTSSGGTTEEITGHTIMVWKTSDYQYETYTNPAWSATYDRWEGQINNSWTALSANPNYQNEWYNYEEGEWGWWVAPTEAYGDNLIVEPYTSYTAITAADGPYWDATLNDGSWGYYTYSYGLSWHSVTQPLEDVCYIYYDGAWGWYQISVAGETITEYVYVEMEWQKATNVTYTTNNVFGSNSSGTSGEWDWYYRTSTTSGSSGSLPGGSTTTSYSSKEIQKNSSYMFNFEKDEWGYWVAPEGTTVTAVNNSGFVAATITNNNTNQVYPYYYDNEKNNNDTNNNKWGTKTTTTTNTSTNVTEGFKDASSQPDENVYYIYYDSTGNGTKDTWGWCTITKEETTTTTTTPAQIAYTYTTTSDATSGSYSVVWFTGYYFNTILRDVSGLDRYGITLDAYRSDFIYPYEYDDSGELLREYGLVANAYTYEDETLMTDKDADAILSAGYSVAYQPTTDDTWSYVSQTQGYTMGDLLGRGSSGQYNDFMNTSYNYYSRTTTVSQVNQGQITTYPYNVNTDAFTTTNSSDSTLDVKSTHHQYYQLNMNSEDVVVWYCLAGDTLATAYGDDVTNLYYIYNIDNVTYTGAGHTDLTSDDGVTEEEAKLFINTMIAAYRAGRVAPSIDLMDEDGVSIESIFFTTEETESVDVILATQNVAATEKMISFKIVDNNLENPDTRNVSLTYTYTDSTGTVVDYTIYSPTLYDSSGVSATNVKLASNTLYTLVIPDEVLTALSDIDVNQITLTITVTSTFSDGVSLYAEDSIDIFKLKLQSLS